MSFNTSSTSNGIPTEDVLSIPSRYSAAMLWAEERKGVATALDDLSAQGVVGNLKRNKRVIKPHHAHYGKALSFIEGFVFPTSIGDFLKNFRPREWDIVGERLLLVIRMRKLTAPSEFQLFLASIYGYEYGVDVCPECGLTIGPWCGK
jgi:hypothetical protein